MSINPSQATAESTSPIRRLRALVLAILIIATLITLSLSLLAAPCLNLREWLSGALQNLATGLLGALVTFLLLDRLLGERERYEEKRQLDRITEEQLIRTLASGGEGAVMAATSELRARGLIESGRLDGLDLTSAHLSSTNLAGASLRRVKLSRADLRATTLDGARLEDADLSGANLEGARLVGAHLEHANLWNANLAKVNLSWCVLYGVTGLTTEQLREAEALWGAVLPNGDRYSGELDLPGDIREAERWGIDYDDKAQRHAFYDMLLTAIRERKKGEEL